MASRNTYLDALKGYAILAVVVGHALQRSDAFGLITPFSASPYLPYSGYTTMPLFFAISGYLIFGRVRRPEARWFLDKARMLLLPWVAWTLVYYAVVRDPFIPTDMPIGQYVITQAVSPSLWYFVVLAECYALAAIGRLLGRLLHVGDLALVAGIVAVTVARVSWLGGLAWYGWWFLGGYFVARFGPALRRVRWPIAVVGCAAYVAAVFRPIISTDLFWRITVPAAGAVAAMTAVYLVTRIPGATRALGYLGIHTLALYAGQFLFVQLLLVHSWVNVPLVAALAVGGSLAIERVLMTTRLTNTIFLGGRALPRATG